MQASTMQSTTESGVICTTQHVWPGAPSWRDTPGALDPRLLRRSRLLESLALAFDRSSLGIANRRSVRGVNYVKRNLSKQEEKSPDKVTVSWQPSEKCWNMCCASICEEKGQSDSEQSPQVNHKSQASNETSFIHNHNIQQREFEKETKKQNFQLQIQQHRLDSTCRSIEYLPDICAGVALGLISGWKPPNARMACVVLETDAWLATLAQRAGCTAFNPWHKGLPGCVWKHQLGMI